jgi:hypothetical protein
MNRIQEREFQIVAWNLYGKEYKDLDEKQIEEVIKHVKSRRRSFN